MSSPPPILIPNELTYAQVCESANFFKIPVFQGGKRRTKKSLLKSLCVKQEIHAQAKTMGIPITVEGKMLTNAVLLRKIGVATRHPDWKIY